MQEPIVFAIDFVENGKNIGTVVYPGSIQPPLPVPGDEVMWTDDAGAIYFASVTAEPMIFSYLRNGITVEIKVVQDNKKPDR